MRIGFKFDHVLAGAFYVLSSPTEERPVRAAITARAARLHRFVLNKNLRVSGTIAMDGIAKDAALVGEIYAQLDQKRVRYDLSFLGDDGKPYTLAGEVDIQPIDIIGTLTTLPASLYDGGGREIGRAVLRFDWRNQLMPALKSFRLEGGLFAA